MQVTTTVQETQTHVRLGNATVGAILNVSVHQTRVLPEHVNVEAAQYARVLQTLVLRVPVNVESAIHAPLVLRVLQDPVIAVPALQLVVQHPMFV